MKASFIICLFSWLFPYLLFGAFPEEERDSIVIDSTIEGLGDNLKFQIFLDTITKYVQRDIAYTQGFIDANLNLLDKGAIVEDSILLKFVILRIHQSYNKLDPLSAYQIISEFEYLVAKSNMPKINVNQLKYLKSFTYMSLGDYKAAQNDYHKSIEEGIQENDTLKIVTNSFSLGQLFFREKDYNRAIDYYKDALLYTKHKRILPYNIGLTNYNLGLAYIELKDYHKAKRYLNIALDICNKNDLDVMKSDLLSDLGIVFIREGDLMNAELIYQELLSEGYDQDHRKHYISISRLNAQLLTADKKYGKALTNYKELISVIDTNSTELLLRTYKEIQKVCSLKGDYRLANEYLLKYNSLKEENDNKNKKAMTSYLQVKFETTQKEKANALLSAKVYKNKIERIWLYSGLGLTFAMFLALLNAYWQKRKYNSELESTVQDRTENLNIANSQLKHTVKELDEFNKILAHDLKEPLRGIVSFSDLAVRNIDNKEKALDYINTARNSAYQLNELIDAVGLYSESKSRLYKGDVELKVADFFKAVLNEIKDKNPDKEIQLDLTSFPESIMHSESLSIVFRNIFQNAVRYNESDIVKIKMNHFVKSDFHHFEISDNGIGIAKPYQQKVFEKFVRLNSKDYSKSPGMGLSIARGLINNIGGIISIIKSDDEGTTFSVKFPISNN